MASGTKAPEAPEANDRTVQEQEVFMIFVYADREERWHAAFNQDPWLAGDVDVHAFRISGWQSKNDEECWVEVDDPNTHEITRKRVPFAGRTYRQVVLDEARGEARARDIVFVAGLDPRS